ncbi:MAG: ATP-binding protein [Bacteroidota bacterium]|nr:ATP-binding protein [Bacteroidota bacterium]
MKLRNRFILFAVFIHSIMAMMAYFLWEYNTTFFVVSELLIIGSVIITTKLYRAFVKPLNILAAGLETLKEKDFSMEFVKMGHYELDQIIDVYNRMIGQLREERIGANEQHHFLDKLIRASPSGIIILDYDNKIQAVNPSAHKYLGLKHDKLIGKTLDEILHPLASQLEALPANESKVIQGYGSQIYKCHKAHFIHKGFHQHFIIMEELTAEILKTEKKAYEKVVHMMSHEINNTVGAVNSILDSVKKSKFSDDEDYYQILQVCTDRNKRMAKFMSNFADVVRLPVVKKEAHDLHVFLTNQASLFSEICKQKNIEFHFSYEGVNFTLHFDEQQMEQVMINIIKNAIESIEKDGKIIFITSQNPSQLIIRDTGRGIDPELQQKLFSPFFSSKREGQGIGLTLTKEILYNHGFSFSLQTNKAGDTDFMIRFNY